MVFAFIMNAVLTEPTTHSMVVHTPPDVFLSLGVGGGGGRGRGRVSHL